MDKLETVARAIDPDAFDTAANCDCEDCQKYLERRRKVVLMAAKEVIAAFEPVTVQEAARALLGDGINVPIFNALDPYNNDVDVWNAGRYG